ncbi:MAG TPA: GAF domain-containing SpoIIE family protein phosphatase [Longimicrobiales bacterium]|nr:GAF domain-containing SpoIIE family protein phosphatase [Longimicrobiales bacterium]
MMNGTTLTDLTPLPPALSALLDAYRTAHPEEALRLWAHAEPGYACVYPDGSAVEMWGASERIAIEVEGGTQLLLEMQAGASDAPVLAHALGQLLRHEREARSAARELSERYEEINLLYFISEILGSVLSVPDAATRILGEVADVLGARRASLWVYDADDQQLHLAAAVGDDGVTGPVSVDDPDSATALVFREKQALNLERGTVLANVSRFEPPPRSYEAFLSVPINYTPPQGTARTVGVITLVGRRSNVRFSAGDARLLSAIASQIGAALETQRLMRDSLRQERLVRELELAHDLQLKLLPDPARFQPPPALAARCVPAESVGGDFYHLVRISGDRLGIMIGDVSSHGFSAALIMALTISAVGIYAQEAGSPAEVLRRVHRGLIKELETTEMYLTLFYAVLDRNSCRLTYANAGHPHAFRIGAEGGAQRLGATDVPLGMISHDAYREQVVEWSPSDLLCLFTDGLSDAFPHPDGGSGEGELVAEFVRLRNRPLADILSHVFAATEQVPLTVPPDDRTALLVRG